MKISILLFFMTILMFSSLRGDDENFHHAYIKIPLTYDAVLEPEIRTLITTDLNAKVTHVYKRMGDRFQKGDLLLQLDNEVVQAMQMKATAAYDKASIIYGIKEILLKDGIASYAEYVDAKASLANAEAELILANRHLRDATIVAPYNGRMVNVNVEEGEYPNQELHLKFKPLLELISDQVLLAKVLIPSRLSSQLEIGQTLTIVLNETEEMIYATVKRIGAVIDPVSSTISVEATVDNLDGHLIPGMTGSATLEVHINREELP